MNEPPFSPNKLAERWDCSKQYIYKLIREKRLKSFNLGGKLVRISAEEVARWEAQQQTTSSESSTDEKSLPGGKGVSDIAFASVMASRRQRPLPS